MATRSAKLANRNLPLLMLQAREQVISRFRPLLNAQGITEQQWRVMRVLLETGPLEFHEISAQCHISSPSLAGILSRMEDMDLVARERLGSDQRRVRVSLRPRSRELAARLAPKINATYREIEAQLGMEASRRLFEVLDGVLEALATPKIRRSRRESATTYAG
jgi:homoprotocatechuate degradation regulator HpaR